MGDRISFCFKKKATWDNKTEDKSVVFFSHWDGRSLLKTVKEYAKGLKEWQIKNKDGISEPLNRSEPDTVMVDFIVWFGRQTNDERITGNYYLGKDTNDGDDSDNGHWMFDLDEMDWV